jgi:hypothetical protein
MLVSYQPVPRGFSLAEYFQGMSADKTISLTRGRMELGPLVKCAALAGDLRGRHRGIIDRLSQGSNKTPSEGDTSRRGKLAALSAPVWRHVGNKLRPVASNRKWKSQISPRWCSSFDHLSSNGPKGCHSRPAASRIIRPQCTARAGAVSFAARCAALKELKEAAN